MGIRDWLQKQSKDKEDLSRPPPSPERREDHLMETISRPNGIAIRRGPRLILREDIYYDDDIRKMNINRLRVLFGDLTDVLEEVKGKVSAAKTRGDLDQDWLRRAEHKIKILSKYERMVTNLMFDKKGIRVTQLKENDPPKEPEEEIIDETEQEEETAKQRNINDVFREVAQEELEPEHYYLVLGMVKERLRKEQKGE